MTITPTRLPKPAKMLHFLLSTSFHCTHLVWQHVCKYRGKFSSENKLNHAVLLGDHDVAS